MLTGARPSFPSPGLGVHAWTAFLEPRRLPGACLMGFPMPCFGGVTPTPSYNEELLFSSTALEMWWHGVLGPACACEGNSEACCW